MAKSDLIKAIVSTYPERELDPKELDENYTVEGLEELQDDLAKEKAQKDREEEQAKKQAEERAKAEAAKTAAKKKKYRLKDPKTQYAEGSFSIAGKQVKTLPANPSPELSARVRSGFLVEVK